MAAVPTRYSHLLHDDLTGIQRNRRAYGKPSGIQARNVRESRIQQVLRAARNTEIKLDASKDVADVQRETYTAVREHYQRTGRSIQPIEAVHPSVLNRWCVNFLRHECTTYDRALLEAWDVAGYSVDLYRDEVRRRILGLIASGYPELEQECMNQRAQAKDKNL